MNYQDTMATWRVNDPPDLVLTFTCNTKWRDIADALRYRPGQQPCDQFDLIVRVFHQKVGKFIEDIREGKTFGAVRAVLYTVEFQKRGLPHIYCLVWLVDAHSKFSACAIDGFICATHHDVAKNLFTGEEAGDDNGDSDGNTAAAAKTNTIKHA